MLVDSPRPRRGRRILVPLLIVLLIVGVLAIVRLGDVASAGVAYLEEMRVEAGSIDGAASTFAGLGSRIGQIDRNEFESILTDMSEVLSSAMVVTTSEPPTPELIGPAALYRLAVSDWSEGVTLFREGVLMTADQPQATTGPEQLVLALYRLRAGDETYAHLLGELERQDAPQPIAPLPEVLFVEDGAAVVTLANRFVVAARASTSALPLRADLKVQQVVSNPAWVSGPDRSLVVPATETITLSVVIANSGNGRAGPQTVEVVLTNPDGEQQIEVAVPALEAGDETAVTTEELQVSPGTEYQAVVRLLLSEPEVNVDDNVINLTFRVNDETG
jgi:hypothetical protein